MTHARAPYSMLTTAQFAPRVDRDASTVRRYCRAKQVPGAKKTAAGWRIPPASVKPFNAWLKGLGR